QGRSVIIGCRPGSRCPAFSSSFRRHRTVRTTFRGARGAAVALLSIALLAPGCNRKKDQSADSSGNSSPAPVTPTPGKPSVIPVTRGSPGPPIVLTTVATTLYGKPGGEKMLAANDAAPSPPLRPQKGDTFYNLPTPRLQAPKANGPFPPRPGAGQVLAIDY